ncbi:hypothetical protein LCGC14_2841070 [marine sediment metagenome]|uniref:Uncharacterized protein n=1 Tax=marine sediment metagenome TaxID=412755 RepID=A0A0F9B2A4_9ZZZZ
MSRSAKVTSIDAVEKFTAALRSFQEEASTALENVAVEVRRAVDWVQNVQRTYWIAEIRRGRERLAETKAELERARSVRSFAGHEPSLLAEKKAVDRAKRRLRLAEEKVDLVRQWARRVDRAVIEYEGSTGQLTGWLLTDCPRAVAALVRMSRALESYVALQQTVELPTESLSELPSGMSAARSGVALDVG